MDTSWQSFIEEESKQSYFKDLKEFVTKRRQETTVYPKKEDVFTAFNYPLDNIKAVILGQDPYHGPNQAHGLAFSVLHPTPPPPSLINIYKELQSDILGWKQPQTGNLTAWSERGVFLLNTLLTVDAGKPASHAGKGWEVFTLRVIKKIAEKKNVAFLLWGNHAKSYEKHIHADNAILKAGHPSPMSCKMFFGCSHFSKTNDYLRSIGRSEIDWSLSL